MTLTPLPSWAKGALWIGLGAMVGYGIGQLFLDTSAALDGAFGWLLLVLAYTGAILFIVHRQKRNAAPVATTRVPVSAATPAAAKPRPTPSAPRTQHALALTFALPDIPSEFPPVMGHLEPLRVDLAVTHGMKAAAGAAVRLTGRLRDGAQFVAGEGVTGSDGTVRFTVKPHGTGELLLEAEARMDALTGAEATSASVVHYDEEIDRLFGEFRTYAVSVLGPDAHADTARELAERLRNRAPPEVARALQELARIYELVAYGQREADRSLYISLMHALLVLERGELPEPPRARTAEV